MPIFMPIPRDVPRRTMCPACLLPQSTCCCDLVRHAQAVAEVLILQHPLEAGHAKGSGRLLHLSLPGSRLETGETFDPVALSAWLQAPGCHGEPVRPVLLYPHTEEAASGTAAATVETDAAGASRLRLVVLDATWRKSRKMLYANPVLQALPRMALPVLRSRYRIRKAHRDGQLSTLEATVHALHRIEGEGQRHAALLDAFDAFVARRAARMAGEHAEPWLRPDPSMD